MKQLQWCVTGFLGIVLLSGCGSNEPLLEDEPSAEPATTQAPPEQEPQAPPPAPSVAVETHTDTVTTLHQQQPATEVSEASGERQVQSSGNFVVQIGAFKKARHATACQKKALERFPGKVLNAFDQPRGLYLIRVGSFASRSEAMSFADHVRSEFTSEYRDAFVATTEGSSR